MGRRIEKIKWLSSFSIAIISVLFLAIVFVLFLIFSESDKRQNKIKEEIAEEEEYQSIDLEKFDVEEDGGFYVIEALPVPKEWR